MANMAVLIMKKDRETGFLQNELGSYSIEHDTNLIDRIYAVEEDKEKVVHMYVTVNGEFEEWEFNAILDNYDGELYGDLSISIQEDEESYNPTWIIKFMFDENDDVMERKLNKVLEIHEREVKRVLDSLKDLEEEYKR